MVYALAFSVVLQVVSEEWPISALVKVVKAQIIVAVKRPSLLTACVLHNTLLCSSPLHQHRPRSPREAVDCRSAHSRVKTVTPERDNDRQQPTEDARTHTTAKAPEQEGRPEEAQWTRMWTSRRTCTVAISLAYLDRRSQIACKPMQRKPGHKESQQARPCCQSPCP